MKINFACFLFTLFIISPCYSQNRSNGFIELGFRGSRFMSTYFLQDSRHQNVLSDPSRVSFGNKISPSGLNNALKLRFGISFTSIFQILGEFGYSKYDEKILAFCHYCELLAKPETVKIFESIHVGSGFRYQFVQSKHVNVHLDFLGYYAFLINEKDIRYFSMAVQPVIEIPIYKNLFFNTKFGYEKSFYPYRKQERFYEFALGYTFQKQNQDTYAYE